MSSFLIVSGEKAGQEVVLQDKLIIGSSKEATLILKDKDVQPIHAIVTLTPDGFFLESASSDAVILANGYQINNKLLKHGDLISIGNNLLLFSSDKPLTVTPTPFPVDNIAQEAPRTLTFSVIEARTRYYDNIDKVVEHFKKDERLAIYLETLYKVGTLLNSSLDTQVVMQSITTIIRDIFSPDRIFILLYDESGKLSPWIKQISKEASYRGYTDISKTIVKQAIEKKEAILSRDAIQDERFGLSESIVDQHILSVLCVPIVKSDKVFGVIQVDTTTKVRHYTDEDLKLLNAISAQFAIALDNAILYNKTLEYNRKLVKLGEAVQKVNSYMEVEPVIAESTHAIKEILECKGATIFLFREKQRSFVPAFSSFISMEAFEQAKIPADNIFIEKLFSSPKGIVITRSTIEVPQLAEYLSNTALVCGIISFYKYYGQQKRLGFVVANDKLGKDTFDPVDCELLTIFLSQIAITLENALLFEKATVDPLTRVYNRQYFILRLEDEIKNSLLFNKPLSLLFADIDNFKQINDNFGHLCGDEVLATVAWTIKQIVRQNGIVGRYGGEEFLIALPATDASQAKQIAEDIRQAIKRKILRYQNNIVTCTLSLGGTELQPDDNVESLIQRADQLMYQSKLKGKDATTFIKKQSLP